MKIREVSLQELFSLCRYRLAKGKQAFTVYLPPTTIPPIRPLKRVEIEDTVVGVSYQFYVKPSCKDGGWLVKVRVITKPFNTLGEALKQASNK
jgi:hypothetical protein